MIKVRFNLARGKNYKKWKIQSKSDVEYHNPNDVQLIMKNCYLKNYKKLAQKIFEGENKDVCAWIVCESITIKKNDFLKKDDLATNLNLKYNPKIAPYWRIENLDYSFDDALFNVIVTFDNLLFTNFVCVENFMTNNLSSLKNHLPKNL